MRGKTRKHNHTLLHPMADTVVFRSADQLVVSDFSWEAFIGLRHSSTIPFPWGRWWCFIAETCAEWRMSDAFDKYARPTLSPYLSNEPRCLHLGLESRMISHKTAQGTCWSSAWKLLYKISHTSIKISNLFSPEVLTAYCKTDECETWIRLMKVCHVWCVKIVLWIRK